MKHISEGEHLPSGAAPQWLLLVEKTRVGVAAIELESSDSMRKMTREELVLILAMPQSTTDRDYLGLDEVFCLC